MKASKTREAVAGSAAVMGRGRTVIALAVVVAFALAGCGDPAGPCSHLAPPRS